VSFDQSFGLVVRLFGYEGLVCFRLVYCNADTYLVDVHPKCPFIQNAFMC